MIEQVAKAMWDARRYHAKNAGLELELWGDGTIPKINGVMEEARAALVTVRDMFTAAGNSSYDLAADAIDAALK